jgi:hypothetical protein
VWLTEYGVQSIPDRYGTSLQGQAAFLRAAMTKLKGMPRISTLVWFLIRDEAVEARGRSDQWQSGVRTVDGRGKPSYTAWQATAPARPAARPLAASAPIIDFAAFAADRSAVPVAADRMG